MKIEAAKDIRRLTKTSQRCRRQLADAVKPLVCMLRVGDDDSVELSESALLALLNLAVKDEKYVIVTFFYLCGFLGSFVIKVNCGGFSQNFQRSNFLASFYLNCLCSAITWSFRGSFKI